MGVYLTLFGDSILPLEPTSLAIGHTVFWNSIQTAKFTYYFARDVVIREENCIVIRVYVHRYEKCAKYLENK